jgi:hypothetical protein
MSETIVFAAGKQSNELKRGDVEYMKLSDFLIRGRHFFGFLIPGIMWIACLLLLFFKKNPMDFVEDGKSPAARAVMLIAASYITGFCIQTLLFPVLVDIMKKHIGVPCDVKDLGEQIQRILVAKLPENEIRWTVPLADLPIFCKFYILEHSKELKNILLEKEDDINFIAANILPGPLLIISWFIFKGYPWWIIVISIICLFVIAALLFRRLVFYLRSEKVEWYEIFLLLQLGGVKVENSKDKIIVNPEYFNTDSSEKNRPIL